MPGGASKNSLNEFIQAQTGEEKKKKLNPLPIFQKSSSSFSGYPHQPQLPHDFLFSKPKKITPKITQRKNKKKEKNTVR